VPLNWFVADACQGALLVLPALGIQAKLYTPLAQALAASGWSVCVMEQRGHGASPLRPGRNVTYRMGDLLDHDMPAALAWLAKQTPGKPLLLAGHSLGGHLSTIYAGQHPGAVAGIVHLACAFPYHRDYQGAQARLIRLLCTLIPICSTVPGYFPGNLLGFGGRESAALMQDWADWAGSGSFDFGDRHGLAEAVSAFKGPVISICFDRDNFATDAAIDRALSPFINGRVTRLRLGSAEQGEHLGHVGWARNPKGVSGALLDWLAREF
jgi:predicted alpha/beta hydrolase